MKKKEIIVGIALILACIVSVALFVLLFEFTKNKPVDLEKEYCGCVIFEKGVVFTMKCEDEISYVSSYQIYYDKYNLGDTIKCK